MKQSTKRKILVALTGTGLAQLIHLIFSPIISRLYNPDEFGQLALFISLLGVITAFSTGRYDIAIVVAKEEEKKPLTTLIKKIALLSSLLVFIITVIVYLVIQENYVLLFLFLTIATYLRATYASERAVLNSYGDYKNISIGRILENLSNGLIGALLSFTPMKFLGLLAAKTFSLAIGRIYYRFFSTKGLNLIKESSTNEKDVFNKYIEYPKYTIFSELIVQLNLGISIFSFASIYSASSAGFIGLTTRVLSLPINFIGISFLDVFREKATKDFQEYGSCEAIFLKFLACLILISLPILSIIYFYGVDLFILVFGEKWATAGEYAQTLIFLYTVRLLTSPLGFTFFLNNAQKQHLFFQSTILISACAVLLSAYLYGFPEEVCLKYYAGAMSLNYLIYLIFAYRNCRKSSN